MYTCKHEFKNWWGEVDLKFWKLSFKKMFNLSYNNSKKVIIFLKIFDFLFKICPHYPRASGVTCSVRKKIRLLPSYVKYSNLKQFNRTSEFWPFFFLNFHRDRVSRCLQIFLETPCHHFSNLSLYEFIYRLRFWKERQNPKIWRHLTIFLLMMFLVPLINFKTRWLSIDKLIFYPSYNVYNLCLWEW